MNGRKNGYACSNSSSTPSFFCRNVPLEQMSKTSRCCVSGYGVTVTPPPHLSSPATMVAAEKRPYGSGAGRGPARTMAGAYPVLLILVGSSLLLR